jgi:hypothetical protein
MSIETDLFPVTSADGDVGTTLRRYIFQGSTESAVGDDGSTNASDLENFDDGNPMTYQEQGYGDAVKSDGDDEAVETVASANSYLIEASANTSHTDTTAMTIEGIMMFDDWFAGTWAYMMSATDITDGWAIYGGLTTNGFTAWWGTDGVSNRIFTSISQANFNPSDGDWIYFCAVYDSTQSGNDRAEHYLGNLTSTTANVIQKTSTLTGGAGDLGALNTKMAISGPSVWTALTHRPGSNFSVFRIQDKAFSLATAEQRYDDIKAWVAAAGLNLDRVTGDSAFMPFTHGGVPTSSEGKAERAAAAHDYSGILAASPVVGGELLDFERGTFRGASRGVMRGVG